MREYVEQFLNKLLGSDIEKDSTITNKDIKKIESKYRSKRIVFPIELEEFYIKYNHVMKYNISFEDIINKEYEDSFFPRITLKPLVSRLIDDDISWTLDMVLYYEENDEYLDGLIPIGIDDGGAIVCYKIDDGTIIEYLDDLEDKSDYEVVASSFEELFEYLDVNNDIQ